MKTVSGCVPPGGAGRVNGTVVAAFSVIPDGTDRRYPVDGRDRASSGTRLRRVDRAPPADTSVLACSHVEVPPEPVAASVPTELQSLAIAWAAMDCKGGHGRNAGKMPIPDSRPRERLLSGHVGRRTGQHDPARGLWIDPSRVVASCAASVPARIRGVDSGDDRLGQLLVLAAPLLRPLVVVGVDQLAEGLQLSLVQEPRDHVPLDHSVVFDRLDVERDGAVPGHLVLRHVETASGGCYAPLVRPVSEPGTLRRLERCPHQRTTLEGEHEVKAQTLTPANIFGYDVRYVIPLFQRPYVWNEQDQWDPLWQDVRRVAEQLLETPSGWGAHSVPPHFLGAVVIDQPQGPVGYIASRHVVDGQQRLTTLQLLLDAAQEVVEAHGAPPDAQALRVLVLNNAFHGQPARELYKVWPTDRDQEAFVAAMDNDTVVPPSLKDAAIVRAHAFFGRQITRWALIDGDREVSHARLNALARTLREQLKIVVIDLEPGDNAQVIFETLNHRGVPLLAADLIKNLVFQVAEAKGHDVRVLYDRYWRSLDGDHWRQRVKRGRLYVPRIDILVNYWLVMRLLREVPSDRIFADFRDRLVPDVEDIETLLADLSRDAANFAALDTLPDDSPEGRFRYRVLQALDGGAVTPFLLWLQRWDESHLPRDQKVKALDAVESWLVRRALCRLTAADINRTVVDLLQELAATGPATAGDVTEEFLRRQTSASRLWPSDEYVSGQLGEMQVYTAWLRARLRMVLEALEDRRRTAMSEGSACPRHLTVEHVMPQGWREHWTDGPTDPEVATSRDSIVHTLGNLTLVNEKLNPSLSNRPWTDAVASARGLGVKGKRSLLLDHSTLKMNADIVSGHEDFWTEESIRLRTAAMIAAVLEIWPRPAEPTAEPAVPVEAEDWQEPEVTVSQEIVDAAGYQPLVAWLDEQVEDDIPMDFDFVEEVLGAPLPRAARATASMWHDPEEALNAAVTAAGFRPVGVDLTDERVTFSRVSVHTPTEEDDTR